MVGMWQNIQGNISLSEPSLLLERISPVKQVMRHSHDDTYGKPHPWTDKYGEWLIYSAVDWCDQIIIKKMGVLMALIGYRSA